MNPLNWTVAPSMSLSDPSSTWMIHVLRPLAGGAGVASRKRIFSIPSAAVPVRPTAYASARGSAAHTDAAASAPPLDVALLSPDPALHAATLAPSASSAAIARPRRLDVK